jgi:ABC-type sugar transport system ATPase subunit
MLPPRWHLSVVAELEDASDIEIYISGRLVDYVSPNARDVAMVFQNYALYLHMAMTENIASPLKMSGVSRPDARRVAPVPAAPVTMTGRPHDQVEAMTMADRVGRHALERDAAGRDAARRVPRPVDTFVTRFVGCPQTNLFEGRVDCGADRRDSVGAGFTACVPEPLPRGGGTARR